MKARGLRVVLAVGMFVGAGMVMTSPAGAAPVFVSCGQTITVDTTLAGPVSNCINNGIVVGASGITLDLNGFTVSGTPNVGDGAGVLVSGRTRVTVKNGRVRLFDGGVILRNSNNSQVTNIIAEDNVGESLGHPPAPGTPFGDGIALLGSSNNTIRFNTVQRNAPWSGIGIYEVSDTDHPFPEAPARNNLIEGNTVLHQTGCRLDGLCDNDGIRVEPFVGPGNRIQGNTVGFNSLDGIALFGGVNGTTVTGNQVFGNGFSPSAAGDGIRVFGFNNYIANNNTNNNLGGGVSVGRRTGASMTSLPGGINGRDNQLLLNTATGNVRFDLWDSNPGCDNNTWNGNKWHTANQACTTVGGQQI